MKKLTLTVAIFILGVLFISCAAKSPTSQKPALPEATASQPKPVSEAWEVKWENTLREARKEGKVVMYSTRSPDLVLALREAFTKRYGIQLESMSGRGASLHEKVVMEYRAGVTGADVYFPGTTGLINVLKPAGAVDSVAAELILPDLTEPEEIRKVWLGGELTWVDKERMGLIFLGSPNVPFAFNTELVRPEELTSYLDLLNPKWKERIIMDDPTQPGGGLKWVGVVGEVIMGWDYIRELVKQQPMISRDHRLMTEWLARGKYAIAIQIQTDMIPEFQRVGAPLMWALPKEGTHRSSGVNLVMPKGRPHPNAARIFANWTLGAESGAIWTAMYRPSLRNDVSKKDVDPVLLFKPGVEYFNSDSEEWVKKEPQFIANYRDIFAPLLK